MSTLIIAETHRLGCESRRLLLQSGNPTAEVRCFKLSNKLFSWGTVTVRVQPKKHGPKSVLLKVKVISISNRPLGKLERIGHREFDVAGVLRVAQGRED